MKNLLLKISILFLFIQVPLTGQTSFTASSKVGCDTLTVKFTYTTTIPTVDSVRWKFGDGVESTEESPVHKYIGSGSYTVSLVVNVENPVIEPDFIKVGETPGADFQSHDTLEIGARNVAFIPKRKNDPPFPYNYSWSISDGATGNIPDFIHKFDTTGIFTARLIISDALGCADTTTKTVEVRNILKVPNVFTPNDDGYNDLFIIEGNNETTYSIQIFSRSGMKVFEVSAKVIVWDGRMFSGEQVRDGIYYYVIESKDSSTKLKQTGFFYIYGSYH